jgi:hypothetical protein
MSDPAFSQQPDNPGSETSPFSLLSRRKAAGILGAAGAAIIGGGSPASAFLFRKAANPEVNLSTLPEPWAPYSKTLAWLFSPNHVQAYYTPCSKTSAIVSTN